MIPFTAPLHNERVAARLGLVLGIAFTTCFATGLYSHFAQHPTFGFVLPSRPVGLYRFTQGLHVATGIASIPLLFAKLWTVYPKLFQWPIVTSVANAIERIAIFPLVAGSLFMLFTGLANTHLWYPWRFNFPDTHYRTSWIVMGALAIHIGAKITTTRRALARLPMPERTDAVQIDRRRFLATVFATSGVITFFTLGQTFRPLARFALLSPRRSNVGPQGFPINATAKEAGVLDLARSREYRLEVSGKVAQTLSLSIAELHAMPQHSATLPISCVEGWSASATWTGVRLRDLLSRAGADPHGSARVESFQPYGSYRVSEVNHVQAHDTDTLLALKVNGQTLALDHGYPVRLIAPNRPGVMQTKWVGHLIAT